MHNGKNAYYFSHDCNARNDEKILMLRAEHGWEGYGLFWALVEMMFENKETCLHHTKIKGIAVSYNIDITLLQSVINTAVNEGLFVSDGEKFWSESLRRRKAAFHELKEKRSEAGKKGMESRWGKPENTEPDNSVITKNNKGKERKVKESKVLNNTKIASRELKEKIKINIQKLQELKKQKIYHGQYYKTHTETFPAYHIIEAFSMLQEEDKVGELVKIYLEVFPQQKKLGIQATGKANDTFKEMLEMPGCNKPEQILMEIVYTEGANLTPWDLKARFKGNDYTYAKMKHEMDKANEGGALQVADQDQV